MKTSIEKEVEKKSQSDRLVGIRTNDNEGATLNAIVFITPTLSTAFPRHDFVKIEWGKELTGNLLITTREHLIELQGERLDRLFDLLSLNRVYSIEESIDQDERDEITIVGKITIAELDDEEEGGGSEEADD